MYLGKGTVPASAGNWGGSFDVPAEAKSLTAALQVLEAGKYTLTFRDPGGGKKIVKEADGGATVVLPLTDTPVSILLFSFSFV